MKQKYTHMMNELQEFKQEIDQQCIKGCQTLSDLLDSKIQATQQILNSCEEQTGSLKRNKQSYFQSIRLKQGLLEQIKLQNNLRKKAIDLEEQHVQNLQNLKQLNLKALQSTQKKNNQILKKYNNKLLVKDKLGQISQSISVSKAHQKQTNLASSRKNFSKLNMKSFASSDKKNTEGVIQFCPQNSELHINIKTADDQLFDFILFYDRSEEKFGLKNPRRNLRSCDILAVRNFNIHQDNLQLYQELKQAILNNVEDVFL